MPSIVMQKLIGERLINSPDVLTLVPADNILDTNGRPEVVPCVLIGEGEVVYRRWDATAYATIHGWISEPGLVRSKVLGSAIVDALSFDAEIERAVLHLEGFDCHDLAVTGIQFMRDPHASYSHCIVTVAAILKEIA